MDAPLSHARLRILARRERETYLLQVSANLSSRPPSLCAAVRMVLISLLLLHALCPGNAALGQTPYKGWTHLASKLKGRGVSDRELSELFEDPRMPPFPSDITFNVKPREVAAVYSAFFKHERLELARAFLTTHREAFGVAQRQFRVGPEIIAAILLIETQFGQNTGKELVVYRLARLSSVGEEETFQRNLERMQREDPTIEESVARRRVHYLEETFLPEIVALLKIAKADQMGVFDFRGSIAGAFGYPQFLPTSLLKYGVDLDGDGKISLYDADDSIGSVARYFATNGWHEAGSMKEKRKVVWQYNRSEAYVEAVLRVAKLLSAKVGPPALPARRGGASPHRT